MMKRSLRLISAASKRTEWIRSDLTLVSLDLARLQSFPTPMQHGITQNREQKLSFQIGIPNSHGIQEQLSFHSFIIIVLHDAMIPPAALLYHLPYKPCTTNNLLICFNLYKLVNWLLNSVCYRNSAKRRTNKNFCLN